MAPLVEELDAISSEYEARFAGQSRATRDLAELDALIARGRRLVARASAERTGLGADADGFLQGARANLEMYEKERAAIEGAKKLGEGFDEFAQLASEANFVFGRYQRHFAGQNRASRDAWLLAEMVDDLTRIQGRMRGLIAADSRSDLNRDVEVVTTNLQRYVQERKAIDEAQAAGGSEQVANVLAQVANAQFKTYRDHFASFARITRRPALLERLIFALEYVRGRMGDLSREGFDPDFHKQNLGIVDRNLELYREELREIRSERQATPLVDLMGLLGEAANQIFDDYREHFAGKAREGCDRDRLSLICDRLGEIQRQMSDLDRAEPDSNNVQNLGIVNDQLALMEREYELVRAANASPPSPPSP